MNYRKLLLLNTVLASVLASPLFAQSDFNQPNEVVVVANRIAVPLRQIGTSVSILEAVDIRQHGNFSLQDILRQTPSIGVSSNGGLGGVSSLRIRGEEGFRTLTILDGLKLVDISRPQVATPIEHIVSSGIDRIEILRGPQGLSYGADAGGVINMTTAPAEQGLSAALDAQAGSFGARQLTANISGANDLADFYLSAADLQADGYNVRVTDSQLRDDDGYDNTSIHLRVGINATENLRLDLVHHEVDSETGYDGCFAGITVHDCQAFFKQQASRLSAKYNSDNFSHLLGFSNTDIDSDDHAQGVSSFSSSSTLRRAEYQGTATSLPGFDLVFGVDFEQEESVARERDNKGFYLEALSDFSESLFLTAGVRQDDNDDYGEHTSYRLSAAYLMSLGDGNELKFRSSYGTGFRAPSVYEIDTNSGPFAYPPASLVSLTEESSKGIEFGIEYRMGSKLRLEAVLFDQEVEDAIDYDLINYSGYLQDSGTSTSDGYELIAQFMLTEELQLSANWTHNESERPNGLQRLRRPQELANLGISWSGLDKRLEFNAFLRVSRDAVDEVAGTVVTLDDYQVLDLTASFALTDEIQLYGRVENALNEDYQQVTGFISPERGAYLGVRASF